MLLDRLISPEEQTGLRKSRTLARAGKFYRLQAKGDDMSALSGACAQVWSRAEHLELPRMQNWLLESFLCLEFFSVGGFWGRRADWNSKLVQG